MALGASSHVAFMLRQAGHLVVAGSERTYGILDAQDDEGRDESGRLVLLRRTTLTIATGELPSLAVDGEVTVDGGTYRVHDIRRQADGALTVLYLAEA